MPSMFVPYIILGLLSPLLHMPLQTAIENTLRG
jgi:hypothetical protein